MNDDWIKCSDRLPSDGQYVWVLFPSGFEYPAFVRVTQLTGAAIFICDRPEVEFTKQPTMWRERKA